jgi:hypothetical protein
VLGTDATYYRNPGVISTVIDGVIVAMDAISGRYFAFNETASCIWDILSESMTAADLCDALAKDYEGDPLVMARDVAELLDELERQGQVLRVR